MSELSQTNVSKKKFSILMATFNSARTIETSLASIRAQNYPQDLVEIMVIDGGSTDSTRDIARKYGCRIIENPAVVPVNAKLIGLKEATGDYLMHVDSDESLLSVESLNKRLKVFSENPEVVMIFSSGYVSPDGVPFAAKYINEFGDPFSMFYYRLSKDARFLIPAMNDQLEVTKDDQDYVIYRLGSGPQPIMENAACANCIDLTFFRENFAELTDKTWGPVHFFYHMQKHTTLFAITRNDDVLHDSADRMTTFLRKIKWRIRNNVFFIADLGVSGFLGRSDFDSKWRRWKKYLYLPYAFLIVPVLLDTIVLMWTRRDLGYWRHFPLTLYTAGTIAGMMVLKIAGYRPKLASYGG